MACFGTEEKIFCQVLSRTVFGNVVPQYRLRVRTPASNWLGFFVLLPGQASTGYKKLLVKDVLSLLRDPGFVPFLMPAELNGFLGNNVQGMKSS